MFNLGDEVRYTGEFKNCLRGSIQKNTIMHVTTLSSSKGGKIGGNAYVYVNGGGRSNLACYEADLELAASAAPEPYEAWFVD